jgi:hypothetical protein
MISTPRGLRWITIDQAMLPVEEEKSIPETGCVRVGQQQFPTATPIGRLIEARRVAGSTRQSQNIERIPGPNPTEIQLGRSGWRSALLPQVASVLTAQDRATRAAGPNQTPTHNMDAPQAGCGFAVLEFPRATVPGGLGPRHHGRQYTNGQQKKFHGLWESVPSALPDAFVQGEGAAGEESPSAAKPKSLPDRAVRDLPGASILLRFAQFFPEMGSKVIKVIKVWG